MGKRLINVDEVEEIVPVLVGKLLENNLITEEQADQIICAIFNDNDRLNEIRELNPDYDISMHKLNVCVGDNQYRLVYCIYVEHKESGTNTFMLIGNNMKSVSTDRGNNWTTSTLGEYTLTDLIYVDSNWYAIGSNGTKRLLLQNTASTFDQSNKILDLPDYSRQVIKINT